MTTVISTVIIALIVLAVIGIALWSVLKDKKQGKSSCGGACGCCPNSAYCHGGCSDGKKP